MVEIIQTLYVCDRCAIQTKDITFLEMEISLCEWMFHDSSRTVGVTKTIDLCEKCAEELKKFLSKEDNL